VTVTVAIPALNEAATIADVVGEARPFGDEVLVLDGGSTDKTPDLAAAAGARVVFDGGGGKGRAIVAAGREAKGDIIVFFDADGSHVAEDIPKLVAPILEDRADHVTASRLIGGSSELHGGFDEFLRLAGSAFITACINKRFRVRLSDSQNGFRAIRRELLNRLGLVSAGTTIEQEMIARSLKLGARLAEVPSHERPRRAGKSHIDPVRDAPRYLGSLVRDVLL
jgi:dolichol-phosphate mannosyltransferase